MKRSCVRHILRRKKNLNLPKLIGGWDIKVNKISGKDVGHGRHQSEEAHYDKQAIKSLIDKN